MSLRAASKQFGIPRSTIQKRLKTHIPNARKSLGRFNRAFTDEMENELKRRVLEMESAFYGISMMDLRRAAYDFAEGNNINHPFNRHTRLAGKDWAIDFNRRHRISVRTPQSTSMSRVVAFDREKVSRFFELLKVIYDRDGIPPHRVYNLDETGITSVPKPGKILALTGRKQVGRIASGEKGRTVTVVAAICASGQFLPPVMIFPRKRMNDRLLKDATPGTIGFVSGNGWIDSPLFVAYLDHFIQYSHASKENKVLLILDNHVSHKSIEAIEKANENGVVLLTLPPHTSSKLQPLDHSVFRSLKVNYSKECDRWMTNNHGKKITEYDMAGILNPAFLRAMTPSNIISGFRSTGIYPYDPNVITEDDYAAADAARGVDLVTADIQTTTQEVSRFTSTMNTREETTSSTSPHPASANCTAVTFPSNNQQSPATDFSPSTGRQTSQTDVLVMATLTSTSAGVVTTYSTDVQQPPSMDVHVVATPSNSNTQLPSNENLAVATTSTSSSNQGIMTTKLASFKSFVSLDIISPVRKRARSSIPVRKKRQKKLI